MEKLKNAYVIRPKQPPAKDGWVREFDDFTPHKQANSFITIICGYPRGAPLQLYGQSLVVALVSSTLTNHTTHQTLTLATPIRDKSVRLKGEGFNLTNGK